VTQWSKFRQSGTPRIAARERRDQPNKSGFLLEQSLGTGFEHGSREVHLNERKFSQKWILEGGKCLLVLWDVPAHHGAGLSLYEN